MNARTDVAGAPWRLDGAFLLVAPAVIFLLLFFIYPFAYGFVLSFRPNEGGLLANYEKFFSDGHLWRTLITTFPMRQSGRKARPGSGQISTLALSVPLESLAYWETRLRERGMPAREAAQTGTFKYRITDEIFDVKAYLASRPK